MGKDVRNIRVTSMAKDTETKKDRLLAVDDDEDDDSEFYKVEM